MERVFIRRRFETDEKRDIKGLQQMNIGVTGLGRNVGTTIVASSLAFFFAEKGNSVTFCQCLTPSTCDRLFYDAVAMEQRFAGRNFTDVYRLLIEQKPVRNVKNRELGINWLLPTSWVIQERGDLNSMQRAHLIQSARDDICVFDLAAAAEWDVFLTDMDRLVVVVDPQPSKLIRHSDRFRMLKQTELSGIDTEWIVNRMNSGVSRRQIQGYLKTRQLFWLPEIDASCFYADEFACRFPWENKEIRCNFMEIFTKVSQ